MQVEVFESSDEDIEVANEHGESTNSNIDMSLRESMDKEKKRPSEEPVKQLSRKRLCNSEKWKENIFKKSANQGLEYTSRSTKKLFHLDLFKECVALNVDFSVKKIF